MKQRNPFGIKSLDLLNCYLITRQITFLQVILERDGDFTLQLAQKLFSELNGEKSLRENNRSSTGKSLPSCATQHFFDLQMESLLEANEKYSSKRNLRCLKRRSQSQKHRDHLPQNTPLTVSRFLGGTHRSARC